MLFKLKDLSFNKIITFIKEANNVNIYKYFSALVLGILAVIITNVFSVNALPDSLPNCCRLKISNVAEVDLKELNNIADKHNVIICAISSEAIGIHHFSCNYYIPSKDQTVLQEKYIGLKPGYIKDALGNKRIVNYVNMEELYQSTELKKQITSFLVFGEIEDSKSFFSDVNCQLNLNSNYILPKYGIDDTFPFFVIGIIVALLILYNYMDTAFIKKEILLKVIHGDSSWLHYIRKSLMDTALFLVVLCVCIGVQFIIYPVIKFYSLTILIVIPLFVGIWLVNIQLLKIRPKEILYGHQFTKKIMNLLSIFSCIIAIFSCITVLLLFQEIPSIGKFRKSKGFFTGHKDSIFLELRTNSDFQNKYDTDHQKIKSINRQMNEFWNKVDVLLEPICIKNLSIQNTEQKTNWQPLYCNHNAKSYIQELYPEAENINLNNYKAALIIPTGLNDNDIITSLTLFKSEYLSIEGIEISEKEIQIIRFEPKKEIVSLSIGGKSCFELCNNPVIFISSKSYETKHMNKIYLSDGSIFKSINPDELDTLLKDLPVDAVITNAYEQYQLEKKTHNSFVLMTICTSTLILILYISVIHTLLELDYKINAMEISVKKILGWNIIQKNKKHIIMATIELIINLCIAIIISHKLGAIEILLFSLIPFILYLLTIFAICVTIKKIEMKNTVKVLKGGSL